MVFLIGYRASGKTCVGRTLAERIALPFADTDDLVEAELGRSIAEFFRDRGEAAFRDVEERVLATVCAGGDAVVATGGGVVVRADNVDAMRSRGTVVWLTAPAAELRSRLEADSSSEVNRPALRGASAATEIDAVLREREPFYRRAAHVVIATSGKSVAQIVCEVRSGLDPP